LFFYAAVTIYLPRTAHIGFKIALVFFIANLFCALLFFIKNNSQIIEFRSKLEQLQEAFNVLSNNHAHTFKNKMSLQERITRYNCLKSVVEELNKDLELDITAESLSYDAFRLISHGEGVCLLYLMDPHSRLRLILFKAKKENQAQVIKAKEGDIFDFWVLRHSAPLLVENTQEDFRFDMQKLNEADKRDFNSLISAPLVSGSRFLGLLRLDHAKSHFYSQDDLRFLAAVCDVGAVAIENGELFKKTQDLAVHDELTKLYTKGYFVERISEECSKSLRHGRALSLLMLDIDHFKEYNDKFGHTAGDIVLKKVAHILTEAVQGWDALVCRFGGEEFCISLSGADKEKAAGLAQGVLKAVEGAKIILRNNETSVTVSIGSASLGRDIKDRDELIFKADQAMYEAKKSGRNRLVVA